MKYHGHQEEKRQECPNGEGTSGLKVFRGFVEWGDKDLCALPRLQLSHAAWPAQTRTAVRRQATRTATDRACPAPRRVCVAWRPTLAPLGPVPSSHRRVRPELQEHRRQPRLHPGATGPQNAGAAEERAGAPPPPAAAAPPPPQPRRRRRRACRCRARARASARACVPSRHPGSFSSPSRCGTVSSWAPGSTHWAWGASAAVESTPGRRPLGTRARPAQRGAKGK